ncbi:MAG: protein YgfX [Sulfuricellaceae bacterium]
METLHIGLGPSRRLTAGLAAMHVFAGAMLWLSSLPMWLVLPAMPALAGSLAFYLRREGLRVAPAAIVSVSLYSDCRCEFQTLNGEWHEATLLGASFVAPYLTILNLKPFDGRLVRHVVMTPDNVDAEYFRKLRVLLKWRCNEKC